MTKSQIKLLASVVSVTLIGLTGCNTIGSDEFGCTGMPNSVNCMSPSVTYEMSQDPSATQTYLAELEKIHQKYLDDEINREEYSKQRTQLAKRVLGEKHSAEAERIADSKGLLNPIKQPKPVLHEALALRVWIAPYTNAQSDLKMPGLVYTEITPRRWSIGEQAVRSSVVQGALSIHDLIVPVKTSQTKSQSNPTNSAPIKQPRIEQKLDQSQRKLDQQIVNSKSPSTNSPTPPPTSITKR